MKILWDADRDLYIITDGKDALLYLAIGQLEQLQSEIERVMKEVSA